MVVHALGHHPRHMTALPLRWRWPGLVSRPSWLCMCFNKIVRAGLSAIPSHETLLGHRWVLLAPQYGRQPLDPTVLPGTYHRHFDKHLGRFHDHDLYHLVFSILKQRICSTIFLKGLVNLLKS